MVKWSVPAFLLILMLSVTALAQDAAPVPAPGDSSQQVESVSGRSISSFWELTRYAREFRWPLFITLIVGVVLAVKKFIALLLEWKSLFRFLRVNFARFHRREQLELYASRHPSMAADLILHLLKTLQTSPRGELFTLELEKFNEKEKQHFLTFQSRMAFWSDTAGALGLLGTVWGMFITFFRGTMEQQEILSGMGIALITTLMGLVISIILNFIATEVGGFFNRMLKKHIQLSDKLWLWVLSLQEREPESASAVEAQITDDILYELAPLSSQRQQTAVNGTVKSLSVRFVEIREGKKKKRSGDPLVFQLVEGEGVFANQKDRISVTTSSSGKAEAPLIVGHRPGICRVEVKHATLDHQPVQFLIEVTAAPPAEIRIQSGNHQSAAVGEELAEPLAVQLLDSRGAPVPDLPVNFQVTQGQGQLDGQHKNARRFTDERGVASVPFRLGPEPGVQTVEAVADGLKAAVRFESMGQS